MAPGSLALAAGACGVQNTPPGAAALALHARITGLTPGEVEHALIDEKELLQGWSLRASPHIYPTADAPVFTLGLLPADEASIRFFIFGVDAALDKIGITATELIERTATALREELDGRGLTKDQLGIQLSLRISHDLPGRQRNAWRSPSWYAPGQTLGESAVRFALPILALQGLCCHAERRGNRAYIVRADQWLGSPLPEANPEQASAELARRYLHCYGPSTAQHLAEWAGIAPDQAAQAWKLVESELAALKFNRRNTWLLERDHARFESPPEPEGIRFLPPHDPYLQMRDRATLIPDKSLHRLVWRAAGNPGILLAYGRFVGTWLARKKGSRLNLAVECYTPVLPTIRSQIEAEAESLAPFRNCLSVVVKFT